MKDSRYLQWIVVSLIYDSPPSIATSQTGSISVFYGNSISLLSNLTSDAQMSPVSTYMKLNAYVTVLLLSAVIC